MLQVSEGHPHSSKEPLTCTSINTSSGFLTGPPNCSWVESFTWIYLRCPLWDEGMFMFKFVHVSPGKAGRFRIQVKLHFFSPM